MFDSPSLTGAPSSTAQNWMGTAASCLELHQLAAPRAISRRHPMRIVLVVDVGRIAMAIALILELLK